MVTGWIDDAPQTPSVSVSHWRYFRCACGNGLRIYRGGVFHDQQHSNRASTQRFGTEVEVRRGLLGDPKLCTAHRQLSDAAAVNAVQLARPERRLVEVERSLPISYG